MSIEFTKIANHSCSFIRENNNIVIKTPLKNDIYFIKKMISEICGANLCYFLINLSN